MRQAVVIQHVAFEDLGTLEPALSEAGFAIEILQAGVSSLSHAEQLVPELVIVLGAPIGVYEQTEYPFLKDEIRLLAKRIDAGKPTLGICLGAQLMAAAAQATVVPGKNGKEIGWSPIYPALDSGPVNPLACLFRNDLRVLHWHGDTFELPRGAVHLAKSAQYENQAFLLGESCLALQFHPEVRLDRMERWFIGHAVELAHAGISVPKLRAETRQFAPLLEIVAADLWKHWLGQI